jgi:hypothetical protein
MILFVGWFSACGVGIAAAGNWMTGGSTPLWRGTASGLILGIGTLIFVWLRARRWTVFRSQEALAERRRQLAESRDRIIEETRKKSA